MNLSLVCIRWTVARCVRGSAVVAAWYSCTAVARAVTRRVTSPVSCAGSHAAPQRGQQESAGLRRDQGQCWHRNLELGQ